MLNFQNELGRYIQIYLDNALLDQERIQVVSRPLYHSKYKFSIGMDLKPSHWSAFQELKEDLNQGLSEFPEYGQLTANRTTLNFYLYSNEPKTLLHLKQDRYLAYLDFDFLRIIDKAWWDKKLPTPEPTYKFYRTYNFRIRFTKSRANLDLSKLKGPWAPSHTYDTMLYLSDPKDLMLMKLLYSDIILDIQDRSHCPS